MFYHWSPVERRQSINKSGLLPGSHSTDRLWRPPYVCLAPYPSLAWLLSGKMKRGSEHAEWDLWEVWVGEQTGYESLFFDDTGNLKEIRVYERFYKRNITYLA